MPHTAGLVAEQVQGIWQLITRRALECLVGALIALAMVQIQAQWNSSASLTDKIADVSRQVAQVQQAGDQTQRSLDKLDGRLGAMPESMAAMTERLKALEAVTQGNVRRIEAVERQLYSDGH